MALTGGLDCPTMLVEVPVTTEREQSIRQAVERAIKSVAEDQTLLGSGGLFELAYPFVAAVIPDATQEEVRAAFGSLWGIDPADRDFHERVLTVCDRHAPGDDETIKQVLQRASRRGDLEAA